MSTKVLTPKTRAEAYSEAEEFYRNAKENLSKSPIRYGAFQKPKYVKEASAMAYLAALRAIDGHLLGRGISAQSLPTSIIEYQKVLANAPYNGKLSVALEIAYENLHIFGYYRGGVSVQMIKDGFSRVRLIIDTLSRTGEKR